MNNVDKGYDFIRVSIETRLAARCIVAVTSALSTDGSPVVAAGLADVFAAAGKRTLLVSDGERIGSLSARRLAPSPRADVRGLTKTTAAQLVASSAGQALHESFAQLRASYDVVIVDAEAMPASTAAYEIAREADAVLVAVRLGRRPRHEDRVTMKLLADCNANVLGVVPTGGQPAARPVAEPAPAMPELDAFALRTKRQAEVL